jgi:hypothetical protein
MKYRKVEKAHNGKVKIIDPLDEIKVIGKKPAPQV